MPTFVNRHSSLPERDRMAKLLITIDGPAGAGKTTVSRALANRIGYRYIDTGALYRAVAFEVKVHGIDPADENALEQVCRRLELSFVESEHGVRLLCSGKDITDHIRSPEIAMLASTVSARAAVRRCLLEVQRNLAKEKGVVFEGRDMGTVVFPDADVKFFLDAGPRTRALRRYRELEATGVQTLSEVEQEMNRRDTNDQNRSLAPLKPAADAIQIDSTQLTVDQVVTQMVAHIRVNFGVLD
jgi:cytidylate kinase